MTVSDKHRRLSGLGFAPHVAGLPAQRDLVTTVMGQSVSLPVIISPTGPPLHWERIWRLPLKGMAMGIFRHHLTHPERAPETRWDSNLCAWEGLWVPCDRCRVAAAQVEVVTDVGPVYLCQHHHNEHRDAIVAASHLVRPLRPGSERCS